MTSEGGSAMRQKAFNKNSRNTLHDLVTVKEDVLDSGEGMELDGKVGNRKSTGSNSGGKGTKRLSGQQTKMLASKLVDKLSHPEDHGHGHGHGEKAPNILTAIISGIINFLLMFGLCAAYGLIMFSDEHNERHTALGVKMNLGTSMIVGILVAMFSKIRVAIAGPDLNPVVLIGNFITAIQASIADQLDLELPNSRRLASSAGKAGAYFCTGAHLESHAEECDSFHGQLRATTIFATALSSLVFLVLFVIFGRFKFTRYISYIPTSIMEAFLSCIGYKVFLYALKFCKYDPFQFVPAALIGIPLYFMKAYHVGHPGIVMPLGFLLPLGLFYILIYFVMDSSVEHAREELNLMFPKMENVAFYTVWTDSLFKPEYINIQAWLTTLPDLAIMIVVVLLDCLLKINGTEAKLHLKVDKDYEVQLHGMSNILTTLTGSSVGYMQLKFNVINAGVMQNKSDRRGAIVYAALCAACYFGTIEPINFMPRFFVGSLLFFAGAGFVCENLWGSRKYLHAGEWLEVLIILIVFILSGQLLVAVITGGVICGISFIMKYARVPVIDGKPMRGAELKIVERRGPLLLRMIRHITESWLLVVRLKGFVFFASAQQLTAAVFNIVKSEEEQQMPLYRRLRVVVFDCKLLDGIDASASKAFAAFVRDCREHKVRVLWSGLSNQFHQEFSTRGIISGKNVLMDLDEAVMSVEDLAKRYLAGIEKRWMGLHQSFEDNRTILLEHYAFEPFVQILLSTTGRIGCPWKYCSRLSIEGHQTVLWTPGEMNGMLFLVHSGAVALFKSLPQDDESWGAPVAVYRHGWFLNRETIMRMPSKFYGVALEDGELLCWTQEQWWEMTMERPLMMSEILKAIMKQQANDSDTMEVVQSDNALMELDGRDSSWDGVLRKASSFNRQATAQSDDGMAGHTQRVVGGEQFADMPEYLMSRLQNLETASSLKKLKFYDKEEGEDEKGIIPLLPGFLERDLLVAWSTYAHDGKISSTQVCKALMFAGVFDYSQSYQAPESCCFHGKDEFMAIGTKALMWPMRPRDLQVIDVQFRRADTDKDGFLNRAEFQSFLNKVLSKNMHLDEVDGILTLWGKEKRMGRRGSSTILLDLETITSVMSLFIRKHEIFHRMLQGFQEVFGTEQIMETNKLTVDHLMHCANSKLTKQEAEEMIWAANWRGASSEGNDELPWTMFVSAVYVCVTRKGGTLPPSPLITRDTFVRNLSCGTEILRAESSLLGRTETPLMRGVSPGMGRGVSAGTNQDSLHRGISTGTDRHSNEGRGAFTEAAADNLASHMADASPSSPWGEIELVDERKEEEEENSSSTGSPQNLKDWMNYLLDPSSDSVCGRFVMRLGYFIIVLSVVETLLEPFIAGKKGNDLTRQLWKDMEYAVTGIFSLELILRLALANRVRDLIKTFLFWCLIIATVPLYLELLMALFISKTAMVYRAINLLRLARLARLSRLTKNHQLLEATVVSLVVVWGIFMMHELS